MEYLKKPFILFIVIGILFLTNVGTMSYFFLFKEESKVTYPECPICEENIPVEEVQSTPKIKVDIKGLVKKPGVYELEEGAIINDLISLAGGLKSTGTTENINLSRKLNNEDCVVVLSKTELKKSKEVVNTTVTTIPPLKDVSSTEEVKPPSTENKESSASEITPKKVSLNTATKEELMTLSGVGEAKALNIIKYRETKKFEDIKEIMNISGIGEAIYEKIKDFITI